MAEAESSHGQKVDGVEEQREARQLSNKLTQQKSSGCSLIRVNVTSSSPELFYFNCFSNFLYHICRKMCSYFKFSLVLF